MENSSEGMSYLLVIWKAGQTCPAYSSSENKDVDGGISPGHMPHLLLESVKLETTFEPGNI